jgi:inner membrane protein
MLLGVIAHSLPDIDFIASFWLPTADNLHAHRGITHSILFIVLASPLLAWLTKRIFKNIEISFTRWTLFYFLLTSMHILLDAFNNYGVGWFEPFNSQRIAFHIIYVLDPFFSIVPGIAAVILLIAKQDSSVRKFWWRTGLICCSLYLLYCINNKISINKKVEDALHNDQLVANRYLTTPAPLQNWLWFVAAEVDNGYYAGYVSVFNKELKKRFTFYPKNDSLISLLPDREEADKLIQFSQGYYTLEKSGDTILINDLRFGQVTGWDDPTQRFAFYYYLQPAMDNALVVQRGRFANWNKSTFRSFVRSIKEN